MLSVFGSINLDVCVRAARLPRPGETVLGGQSLVSPGGKGANQANAAVLFGTPTRLFGMVGDDDFAAPALANLGAHGVDLSGVGQAASHGTGLAVIAVDHAGDNAIVVAPGANARAQAHQVSDAALTASRALLMQLEVPIAQTMLLAARAKRLGCRVILNASPMPGQFVLRAGAVDVLIVNRIELDQLCAQLPVFGIDPLDSAKLSAQALCVDVLVTLGAEGSILAGRDGTVTTSHASRILPVDTTGAGDTYAGVFAAAAAAGHSARNAMEAASAAAALACLQSGAQVAQPTRAAIDAELARSGQRTKLE